MLEVNHGSDGFKEELGEVHNSELIYRQFFMPEAQLSTFRLSFTYDDPEDQNEPKKRKEIEFLANNMKQVDG